MPSEVARHRLPAALPLDPLALVSPAVDEPDEELADDVLEDEEPADELPDPGVDALVDGADEVVLLTDAGAVVDGEPAEFELPQAASSANGLMRAAAESARRVVFIQEKTTMGLMRLAPAPGPAVRR
ncbi:hypothetical protein [Allobranchiibius sp. GilTou73]|uniref:hypothetical protein n=1 Tax=Allobranchiibius sp. GilTou73 TaxID=2904523 RepID=UPI001F168370|nr:hypothetical protein [Allobranchiibius sp. GilTou73]UIJ36426.1 hypothetical protein LVQ62_08740 [Allobranchiibius sp. GilTou73]